MNELTMGVTLDSALTFSHHISNLTRSSYFQLRRLRTIRKAVSVPIFTSIVNAFVCSRIDYCNSLLIGLPKTRLSPLQTVLNAAARLIARLPRYSHISYYIKEHLHWLPISTRIESKVLLIVLKAQMGVAPKHPRDAIRLLTSAISLRPLCSLDRRELLSLGLGQPWPCLDLLPLLPLLFGIAFHLQLVLLSYHPIFIRPYHFLELVSLLGANRTKSASVCLWLLRGAI